MQSIHLGRDHANKINKCTSYIQKFYVCICIKQSIKYINYFTRCESMNCTMNNNDRKKKIENDISCE